MLRRIAGTAEGNTHLMGIALWGSAHSGRLRRVEIIEQNATHLERMTACCREVRDTPETRCLHPTARRGRWMESRPPNEKHQSCNQRVLSPSLLILFLSVQSFISTHPNVNYIRECAFPLALGASEDVTVAVIALDSLSLH